MVYDIWLVVWNMNGLWLSIQLGMSSAQLTFTPSLFRGVGQPPTRQDCAPRKLLRITIRRLRWSLNSWISVLYHPNLLDLGLTTSACHWGFSSIQWQKIYGYHRVRCRWCMQVRRVLPARFSRECCGGSLTPENDSAERKYHWQMDTLVTPWQTVA